MNLLDETKSAISRSKHSTDDVLFVGSRDEKLGIPWSQAEKVLDIDYDDGYGSQEIAAAMDETRKFITLPGAWLENIIRIAFDAARRKAMGE